MNTKRILIVSVLVCCLVGLIAYQIGSNAAYPGLQTEKWLPKGSITDYTLKVEQFNSTHAGYINATGYGSTSLEGYEYLNSNTSKVFNYAFANLTSGRTHQETVYAKGNFTIDTAIHIPSYSQLILDGQITRTANVAIIVVDEYKDQAASSNLITIEGGVLNGAGSSYTQDMVQIWNLKSGYWTDIYLKNFNGNGFLLNASDGTGNPPNAAYTTFYNVFTRIHFGLISGAATANTAYFYIQHAIDNYFIDCLGSDSGATTLNKHIGFYMPTGYGDLRAEYCHFDHVENFLWVNASENQAKFRLHECILDSTENESIYMELAGNGFASSEITNCLFINEFKTDNTDSLIYVENNGAGYSTYMQISENQKIDAGNDPKYCIEFANATTAGRHCSYWLITGNTWGVGDTAEYYMIQSSMVSHDARYITEKASYTENCNDTSVITHGLSATPTAVILTISQSGYSSTNYVIYWADTYTSTTFTVHLKWSNGTAVDANHSMQKVYWWAGCSEVT